MTKENFALKLISVVIIVVVLFYYNQMTGLAMELNKANEEIEKVVTMQEELNSQKAETGGEIKNVNEDILEQEGKYQDGVYEGVGQGYGGEIVVQITVEGGAIEDVEITSAENEDAAYYNMALEIIDEIIETRETKVDVVSGATYTSNGIIDAVRYALDKAVN